MSLAHYYKGKPRARRRRWQDVRIYALALILMCVILLAYFFWPRYEFVSARGGAVIVDSFYSSTPQFTDAAAGFLTSRGVHVDVYKGENVTVDLYKQLPAYGYSLIILRVHAGILQSDPTAPTFLFTNEPYGTYAWQMEQMEGQVLSGKIDPDNSSEQPLFTVGPTFVAISMEGNFNNSVVILSSCLGLYTDQLADAFVKKGTKVFMGWDEKVTLTHADEACNLLLKALIDERLTVNGAVEKVMTEVGRDKTYNSTLKYYPKEAGNIMLSP